VAAHLYLMNISNYFRAVKAAEAGKKALKSAN
jgi:hypothetical protein